ncbi:MAG: hypothetical protein C0459_10055 [Chitinophaga sp.]|jgi:hypothetical protein|nr:hypothetical protein [Chitinophaga sp.]
MKKLFIIIIVISFFSCKNSKKIPDVSHIQTPVTVQRFEQDFFTIDTNHVSASLDALQKKYPQFLNDYLYNILGSTPQPDSVVQYIKMFTTAFQSVYKTSQKQFPSFKKYQQQIEQGFQFIHYYFPQYPLPKNIITFIGPLDGTANALTSSGMAVGLHAYLGKDFEGYHTEYISQVYPAYKSKKFEPEYVAVNCVKNIIEDMYPDKSVGRPLIERMVEAGKRMYALDACMPYTDDTLKTGYTAKQLQACMDNEKNIWAFFADNNLLYESEPSLISIYVTEGPSTPELSNEAPGFIGLFTGWQIVKKWMAKNDKKTLTDLFKTPAQQIFNEAKYKP